MPSMTALNRNAQVGSLAQRLSYEKEVAHSNGRKRKPKKGELRKAAAEAAAAGGSEAVAAARGKVFKWKRERKK